MNDCRNRKESQPMTNLRSSYFLCVVLAALAFIDCIWSGHRIWTTPVRYEVVQGTPDGAGTNRHYEYIPFQAVSSYGAAPLLFPVLISAIALWTAWCKRLLMLLILCCIFILFVFVTGFSIGGSYMRAGFALILAAIAGLAARKHSGLNRRSLN